MAQCIVGIFAVLVLFLLLLSHRLSVFFILLFVGFFTRLSSILTLFLMLVTSTGCVSLSKGMSDDPVDQNHGKRTFGAFVEDGNIERKVAVNLARASAELDESRIVTVSYNGNVLLAGQVANEDLKTQAGNIAEKVRHVRHVHNELQVVGSNSLDRKSVV